MQQDMSARDERRDLLSRDVMVRLEGVSKSYLRDEVKVKVKVTTVEPDKRVAATQQPAQVTFPYTPENKAPGQALDPCIAELRESGQLVELLEKFGLPARAADVGEPRLIE